MSSIGTHPEAWNGTGVLTSHFAIQYPHRLEQITHSEYMGESSTMMHEAAQQPQEVL